MQFARSGRFVFVAQWVAAVVLPFFLLTGRVLGSPRRPCRQAQVM